MTPRESYEVRMTFLETLSQQDYSEKTFYLVGKIMGIIPEDAKDEMANQLTIMMNGMSEKDFLNEIEEMLKG